MVHMDLWVRFSNVRFNVRYLMNYQPGNVAKFNLRTPKGGLPAEWGLIVMLSTGKEFGVACENLEHATELASELDQFLSVSNFNKVKKPVFG